MTNLTTGQNLQWTCDDKWLGYRFGRTWMVGPLKVADYFTTQDGKCTATINGTVTVSAEQLQFEFLIKTPEWRFFLMMYMMYNNAGVWSDAILDAPLPRPSGYDGQHEREVRLRQVARAAQRERRRQVARASKGGRRAITLPIGLGRRHQEIAAGLQRRELGRRARRRDGRVHRRRQRRPRQD